MEDPRPVHAALGQQEMQVWVEVDPIPEGLDSDNDAGDELFARQGLEVDRQRLNGAMAELPEELSPELEEDPQRPGEREAEGLKQTVRWYASNRSWWRKVRTRSL